MNNTKQKTDTEERNDQSCLHATAIWGGCVMPCLIFKDGSIEFTYVVIEGGRDKTGEDGTVSVERKLVKPEFGPTRLYDNYYQALNQVAPLNRRMESVQEVINSIAWTEVCEVVAEQEGKQLALTNWWPMTDEMLLETACWQAAM